MGEAEWLGKQLDLAKEEVASWKPETQEAMLRAAHSLEARYRSDKDQEMASAPVHQAK